MPCFIYTLKVEIDRVATFSQTLNEHEIKWINLHFRPLPSYTPQQDYRGLNDISQVEEDEAQQSLLAYKGFHENDSQIYLLSYDFRAECKVKMDALDDERKQFILRDK